MTRCQCRTCPVHANTHPLYVARLAKGLTAQEAAYVIPCSTQHLYDLEAGRHTPSYDMLQMLRTAYAPHLDGVEVERRKLGRPRKK